MKDIFTGKFVRLSAFDPEEMSKVLPRWWRNSEYGRLLSSSLGPMQSPKAAARWMEKEVLEPPPASYFFSIRTLDGDKLIGDLGLDVVDWSGRDAFVGLGIGETEYWGKGYGTDIMNVLLLRAIGAALIVVSLLMLLRLLPERMRPAAVDHRPELSDGWRSLLIILVGFVTGLRVTVTSIGSGAALIPAMVLFYRLDSGVLVGTNVAMGAILAAIANISHIGLGNVNWPSVALLLCGSVPGVWLGSQFHGKIQRALSRTHGD